MKSFEKGEVLTADRLNELLAATAGTADTAGRTVPPRPGIKAQPGLARFNMQAEDACTGEVGALPDYAGMVKAVGYEALEAPRINRGKIQLPLAHDYDPADDSSLPAEQATGGICSINVPEGLKRAQINRGDILLPLAHSDWGEDAEGAMATPGLVYAVQMDAGEDDECSGTVGGLPYIDQGVIHLPADMGGEYGPAFYDECSGSCIGLIRSVEYESNLAAPGISDGNIRLPLCTTRGDCPGVVGGIASVYMDASVSAPSVQNGVISLPAGLQGLQTVNGPRTWADLARDGVVRLYEADAMGFGVQAEVTNGYLRIHVDRI